jgi:hypothetical protein
MLVLLGGAAVLALLMVVGLGMFVFYAIHPARSSTASTATASSGSGGNGTATTSAAVDIGEARDQLASKPMPSVPESASHPSPVSVTDPGPVILLPPARRTGPAAVATGFSHTPEGALAQMAAIDQTALQSGSLPGARAVITAWAMPGGPTASSWSAVQAMAEFLSAAGLSGGGSSQLALVATPLMGQIKGSLGPDFVIACVDFEIDVTLEQTTRGAAADCQRMVWSRGRWMIGPGPEPATPPSVWPDTDTAISVGYRDLRHG